MNRFWDPVASYFEAADVWLLIHHPCLVSGAFIWQLSSVKIDGDGRGVLRTGRQHVLGIKRMSTRWKSADARSRSPTTTGS